MSLNYPIISVTSSSDAGTLKKGIALIKYLALAMHMILTPLIHQQVYKSKHT